MENNGDFIVTQRKISKEKVKKELIKLFKVIFNVNIFWTGDIKVAEFLVPCYFFLTEKKLSWEVEQCLSASDHKCLNFVFFWVPCFAFQTEKFLVWKKSKRKGNKGKKIQRKTLNEKNTHIWLVDSSRLCFVFSLLTHHHSIARKDLIMQFISYPRQ